MNTANPEKGKSAKVRNPFMGNKTCKFSGHNTLQPQNSYDSTNKKVILMNKLLCLIVAVTMTVFSSAAQSAFKMVNGKIYSTIDSSVWIVFTDNLKVLGFSGDDIICESYKSETHDAGGYKDNLANPRYHPNNVTTIIHGEKLILRNYRSQPPVTLESDISPPIKAIRVGQTSITYGNHTWTTVSSSDYGSSSSTTSSSRGGLVSIYDMGVDYYPPPRVLTSEEQKVQAKKHAEQEKKTVQWLLSQATNGSASAECSLGVRYLKGQGVETNVALGRSWLEKAAAQDDTEAIYWLQKLTPTQTNVDASATNSELKSTQSP